MDGKKIMEVHDSRDGAIWHQEVTLYQETGASGRHERVPEFVTPEEEKQRAAEKSIQDILAWDETRTGLDAAAPATVAFVLRHFEIAGSPAPGLGSILRKRSA